MWVYVCVYMCLKTIDLHFSFFFLELDFNYYYYCNIQEEKNQVDSNIVDIVTSQEVPPTNMQIIIIK